MSSVASVLKLNLYSLNFSFDAFLSPWVTHGSTYLFLAEIQLCVMSYCIHTVFYYCIEFIILINLADSSTLNCNLSDQFIFSSWATNCFVLFLFKLHVLNSTGPIFLLLFCHIMVKLGMWSDMLLNRMHKSNL